MISFEIENSLQGIIAGVDEAGRGPVAGPVVAGAVIINNKNLNLQINDSKKLSAKKREELFSFITSNYIYSYSIVRNNIIDEINILQATKLAMRQAVMGLSTKPQHVLIDGNQKINLADNFIEHTIIKGDEKSFSIAAGSIVAKVIRDRIMQELDAKYPQYLWQKNKGYPTKEHFEMIKKHGVTPYHRLSFL
ncbi:MAG: ribonuclease HII [Alphaproteobacteria bacterium]|jgi:ribonuclease HII